MVVWVLIVFGEMGNPTKMSQWVYDAYKQKQKISTSIRKQKIVIVAGSNALFGINSKALEEAFGLSVLNDAVNAGIDLPCTLFMAEKVIRKGDIILLPLEYPMYSYEGKPGIQMIDFLLAREPECFWRLTWQERFYLIWHVSLKRLWKGYSGYIDTPVNSGIYGAHHIDGYGDQTHTERTYRTERMYNEVCKYDKHPESYGKRFDINALGWDYLEKFIRWCELRHAKVIFMPSTLMWNAQYKNDPKEQWFYTHIAKEIRKRGWIYIGKPYNYMYDKSLYFNTNFHLIDSARKLRTEQMIKDLKEAQIL